jgi:transposase-like protein
MALPQNQLFTWRRLVAQGSLTAAGSGEEVVPASDYRALQNQVRELHRLLGKKTLEAEIERSRSRGIEASCGAETPTACLWRIGPFGMHGPMYSDKRC